MNIDLFGISDVWQTQVKSTSYTVAFIMYCLISVESTCVFGFLKLHVRWLNPNSSFSGCLTRLFCHLLLIQHLKILGPSLKDLIFWRVFPALPGPLRAPGFTHRGFHGVRGMRAWRSWWRCRGPSDGSVLEEPADFSGSTTPEFPVPNISQKHEWYECFTKKNGDFIVKIGICINLAWILCSELMRSQGLMHFEICLCMMTCLCRWFWFYWTAKSSQQNGDL